VLGTKTVQGLDGGRIRLYERFNNLETGEVVLLVGNKPPKGETKGRKFEQCRKFEILKVKSDLTLERGETFEFEHNYGINFVKSLTNDAVLDSGMVGYDISKHKIAIYMSPIKSILSRKFQSDDPGKHKLLILNSQGKIESNIDINAPSSGWVIEDLIASNNGKDVYFYGPSKDGVYISDVQPMNSPLTANSGAPDDIKYKSFQMMKLTDGKLVWINATPLTEFKEKTVVPPSQKKAPQYIGKNFMKSIVYVTQKDEIIIAGQKYTTRSVPVDPAKPDGPRMKIIDNYKDLVMFHFDNQGVLKAQYGIRRDKNNQWSKANLTPQDIVENENGSTLYWIYGEIQGMRQGLDFGGGGGLLDIAGEGTVSKRKLLYYPTVAKVDLGKASMGDFVPFGADAKGKQLYYTHPNFSHVVSSDYSKVTFIGEDKKGSVVWMGQMNIE
ncbi:MAG: hypothetical protein MRY83_16855, partial [Flavobacteriales bacterium]|nr:hypothetical protein [Flavobacteriales bacterium]